MRLEQVTIVVDSYDEAIAFFVDVAGNRWDLLGPPLESAAAQP